MRAEVGKIMDKTAGHIAEVTTWRSLRKLC